MCVAVILLVVGCNKQTTDDTSSGKSIDNDVVIIDDPYPTPDRTVGAIETDGITVGFRATQKYFYNFSDNAWKCVFLKGVNMGLTEATTSLSNPNTTYNTYMEWLAQIAEMNANTIKVFTVMNPNFYHALYDYNIQNPGDKLYLIQGIWFNENYLYDIGDAYGKNGQIVESFQRGTKETIDIIHGNSSYTSFGKFDPAIYKWDVSPFVVGCVLGLEWPAEFVTKTNQNNADKSQYKGTYLQTTESATPFEAFLCQEGNYLIDYETVQYKSQTPIAFLNWPTTDTLTHTNEPFDEEDAVSVNTENILSSSAYFAGQFAAVDIYPYYPEFLNYQEEYVSYIDSSGKSNPYRAYLKDLLGEYTVPVIVAEFGVPTSRGVAHNSTIGYNQGGMTEEQQGEYVSQMINDIAKENYAGAMIFSWQDEWFKQTWNTVKYGANDAETRTPNVQSAEQSYGILAMEAGKTTTCYVDGETSDWKGTSPLYSSDDLKLYTKYDEAYLYLFAEVKDNYNFDKDTLLIPISITGNGSKSCSEYNVSFSSKADFLVAVNGKSNTRVLTDEYYDLFYYQYSVKKQVFSADTSTRKANSGVFNVINQFTSNEIVLPVSGKTIQPQCYESGLLTFGNSNPQSDSYNSLADFNGNDSVVEIRISWYLLNVANISEGIRIDDFYKTGDIAFTQFNDIKIGAAIYNSKCNNDYVSLKSIGYEKATSSTFHTRLKKSYSIIAETLKGLME